MTPSTTAIIVTYNSGAEIRAAIEALRPMHDAGELSCIVVDNASSDNSIVIVREYPWIEVIASSQNLGYGRALNVGLLRTRTPYVMFMNPDAVIRREALAQLREFLATHPRAAIAAPAIVQGDGGLQHAGLLPSPWLIVARAAGLGRWTGRQRRILPGEAPFRTDWLCGALLLARTSAVLRAGGFDPRFFLYFEETDLCRRLVRMGYQLWAVGLATAHHVGGASSKRSGRPFFAGCIAEHYFRSRFYYLCKHHGLVLSILAEIVEVALLATRSIASKVWRRVDDCGFAVRIAAPFLRMPARPQSSSSSMSINGSRL